MLKHLNERPRDPDRIVVLGARGFIGQTLMDRLAVEGIERLGLGSADLDLTGPGAVDRLKARFRPNDAVVMLAALTPDKGRDLATFMHNLSMVASVCAALEQAPVAHVVYISSDAVYPLRIARITGETCAQPDDLYGTMHRTREVMFGAAVEGPLAVLRPSLVYGAADTHNSYGPNRFRRMARTDGRITLFGAGEERRDHVLVDDLAEVITLVLRQRSAGTLNVATGTSISFDELARKVAALFDPPAEVVHTPRQNPVTHRHFDVTDLMKAFPTFRFTPIDDGLAKTHREMVEGG